MAVVTGRTKYKSDQFGDDYSDFVWAESNGEVFIKDPEWETGDPLYKPAPEGFDTSKPSLPYYRNDYNDPNSDAANFEWDNSLTGQAANDQYAKFLDTPGAEDRPKKGSTPEDIKGWVDRYGQGALLGAEQNRLADVQTHHNNHGDFGKWHKAIIGAAAVYLGGSLAADILAPGALGASNATVSAGTNGIAGTGPLSNEAYAATPAGSSITSMAAQLAPNLATAGAAPIAGSGVLSAAAQAAGATAGVGGAGGAGGAGGLGGPITAPNAGQYLPPSNPVGPPVSGGGFWSGVGDVLGDNAPELIGAGLGAIDAHNQPDSETLTTDSNFSGQNTSSATTNEALLPAANNILGSIPGMQYQAAPWNDIQQQGADSLGQMAQSGNINPYLDTMFNAAADATQNRSASEFAGAGRLNSGAHQQNRSQELQQLAAGTYGQGYNAAANRQYGAATQLGNVGSQFQQTQQNQLNAPNSTIGLQSQTLANVTPYFPGTQTQNTAGQQQESNTAPLYNNPFSGAAGGAMLFDQLFGNTGQQQNTTQQAQQALGVNPQGNTIPGMRPMTAAETATHAAQVAAQNPADNTLMTAGGGFQGNPNYYQNQAAQGNSNFLQPNVGINTQFGNYNTGFSY